MSKKDKLITKARRSPSNLSFDELCQLAELAGFKFRNQSGSHKIYKHPEIRQTIPFQENKGDKSKAKPYQVKQLLSLIDDHGLLKG